MSQAKPSPARLTLGVIVLATMGLAYVVLVLALVVALERLVVLL